MKKFGSGPDLERFLKEYTKSEGAVMKFILIDAYICSTWATSSAVNFQLAPTRFSSSCSGFVAPAMTVLSQACESSQAMASSG